MKYNSQIPLEHYNEYGEREWQRLESDRQHELIYHVHFDILKRYISHRDNVIEFGAGGGRFTKDIINMCNSFVTSDISPVQLEVNKKMMKQLGLYNKIESFLELDITNLNSINDNVYDVAVCTGGSINYLFDKEEYAINELLRILKPNGKLILGAMSLTGALIYHMNGVVYEKDQFGIEASRWIFEKGIQDEEHYPVKSKHYVHMMTSNDMDNLFMNKPVRILEKSSAGLFAHSKEEALNQAKIDTDFWDLLIEKEIEFTKRPTTLDCGMNIIYVVEKL